MRLLALAALIAVTLTPTAAAGNVPAPSFDCARAAAPVEKLICSDAGLAAADATLSAVYGKIVAANPAYAAGLRSGQRAFLASRTPCLTGARNTQVACLNERYSARIAMLLGPNLVACAAPKLAGATFTETCIAPNNPLKLNIVLSGKKDQVEAQLASLAVTSARGKQTFKLDGTIFFDGLGSALDLMDVNFDGFADIKLATSTSAGPNMGYDYWLYTPKSGMFTASTLGDQLSGFDITPDLKTKTIAVNGRSSCCSWNLSTYGWKGSALKLITSLDTGMFSPTDLPSPDADTLCGSMTKHFNDAGAITRIDLALDVGDSQCEKDDLTAQTTLLATLKRAPKGYRLEVTNRLNFSIVFDPPKKAE